MAGIRIDISCGSASESLELDDAAADALIGGTNNHRAKAARDWIEAAVKGLVSSRLGLVLREEYLAAHISD